MGQNRKENFCFIFRKSPVRIVKNGSAIKNTANRPYNFTKYNSSVKREEFKEMTSQSQAQAISSPSHCSLYILPHLKRFSFPLPISSAEFISSIPTFTPLMFYYLTGQATL